MQKLKSTFTNMVLSLTLITMFAAGALGGVYVLTAAPIAQAKQQKQIAAIEQVLPAYDSLCVADTVENYIVHLAFDSVGELAGAAVETMENGFGGKFRLMVGFDADDRVVNYEVLEHQETPGLGSHMDHWFKDAEHEGRNIVGRELTERLAVSADGGQVDAITAATISSRAFLLSVNNAYKAYGSAVLGHVLAAAALEMSDSVQALNPDSVEAYTAATALTTETPVNN